MLKTIVLDSVMTLALDNFAQIDQEGGIDRVGTTDLPGQGHSQYSSVAISRQSATGWNRQHSAPGISLAEHSSVGIVSKHVSD